MTDEEFIKHVSKAIPTVPVLDPKFVYVPSDKTDVTKTWENFGWKPKEKTND